MLQTSRTRPKGLDPLDDSDSIKQCSKCGEPKAATEFYRRDRQCKDCKKAYIRQWEAANKERVAESKRRWIERNPDYKAAYYRENAEYVKAKRRSRYQENREAISQQRRDSYDEDARKLAVERQRSWRKANPEKFRAQVANRDARRKGASGDTDSETIQQMYDDQGGLCAYCEAPLFGNFHIEHMVPLSRGGSNHWDNIAVSCPWCNWSKNNKTAEEFITWLCTR